MFLGSATALVAAFCALLLIASVAIRLLMAWKFITRYAGGVYRREFYPRILAREIASVIIATLPVAGILVVSFAAESLNAQWFGVLAILPVLIALARLIYSVELVGATEGALMKVCRLPAQRSRRDRRDEVAHLQTQPLPIIDIDNPNGPLIPREPTT